MLKVKRIREGEHEGLREINYKWELGFEKWADCKPGEVVEVTASDSELEHIRQTFGNIPRVHGATELTWFGDDAKFIWANI